MRLEVTSRLAFEFPEPTDTIAVIQAAHATGQFIEREHLGLPNGVRLAESTDPVSGGRLLRGCLSGSVEIEYRATIRISPRLTLPANLTVAPWSQLPVAVLPYLLPSRYCPVDQFLRFASREFGHISPGGARVLAILDWIHSNVDYVHGVSNGTTSAANTFIDRAGVCRDFTHLGMTLCRASGVPARAVAAYALALDPPDFHAVFEVFLDGGWWLVDPTRLAPVAGMVRIAHGRDAADIAFLTTAGAVTQTGMMVSVVDLDAPRTDTPLDKPPYNPNTVEEAALT
ncbi:transglutaminase-like domain-containing protein [Polymorphobacter fuscus]|uniref:Transglutaminase family protein n=1 Tax=Sandarakinorhabdus fusca TaxID=1439888 RepID=A0A7C9LH84_9SPHN|nr:transglutaminase family protein [Polymorphobacter fuscus]KAB7645616.1 transglutaminase family protein [Polymorphobacter fuscus]MQT18067.1 transglutaminase family protein [Polymorphobacter fuscus]NJC08700.1 transglutaminase-like putative cysteine protease [Polymorphobacter fuscus]